MKKNNHIGKIIAVIIVGICLVSQFEPSKETSVSNNTHYVTVSDYGGALRNPEGQSESDDFLKYEDSKNSTSNTSSTVNTTSSSNKGSKVNTTSGNNTETTDNTGNSDTAPVISVTTSSVPVTDPTRPHYNMGTCGTLAQDAAIIVFFINDDTGRWTTMAARDYLTDTIYPGVDFIKDQAADYGVSLNLDVYTYCTGENRNIEYKGNISNCTYQDPTTGYVYADFSNSPRDILQQIAVNWGFASLQAMDEALQGYTKQKQLAYVIVPYKSGWSHAFHGGGYEYCVVYATDHVGRQQAPSVLAHEILHLFGAEDLYKSTQRDGTVLREAIELVTQQNDPYDVMLWNRPNIQDNVIGSYTAYAIGWRNTIPQAYNCELLWN